MPHRLSLPRFLGLLVWAVSIVIIVSAAGRVLARLHRPVVLLYLGVPPSVALAAGDIVYLSTPEGLEAIGEVAEGPDGGRVPLAIDRRHFSRLRSSTSAVCWRTPLSTSATLDALFPPTIQRAAAERIAADWRVHDERLADAWGPLVVDLSAAYLRLISDDVERALQRREDQLWHIMEWHGRTLAQVWPDVQDQLSPIIQEHLTPVLGRLMKDAISDAPKMAIGYNLARGRQEQAYRIMLDWLADYLARVPEKDRQELNEALRITWEKARENPRIVEPLAKVGRHVLEDQRLRDILTDIYREAITDNPKTAEFLRTRVLESDEVRDRVHALVDAFAPTAKHLAALCLFDEDGTTRPEIVHLVRSTALRRQMAWVTLVVQEPDGPPLEVGAVIVAAAAGGDG